jgi:hypothetical protein
MYSFCGIVAAGVVYVVGGGVRWISNVQKKRPKASQTPRRTRGPCHTTSGRKSSPTGRPTSMAVLL